MMRRQGVARFDEDAVVNLAVMIELVHAVKVTNLRPEYHVTRSEFKLG
jgi:hypothetical protein